MTNQATQCWELLGIEKQLPDGSTCYRVRQKSDGKEFLIWRNPEEGAFDLPNANIDGTVFCPNAEGWKNLTEYLSEEISGAKLGASDFAD